MIDPNAPAYPCRPSEAHKGLTKREHIAVEAMKGILSSRIEGEPWPCEDELCDRAVEYADALIFHIDKNSEESK